MKKTILAIATLAALLATAKASPEAEAMDHGFYTAALEVACGDALTVTNPALRAKRDKMYREDPRWRKNFLIGYNLVFEPYLDKTYEAPAWRVWSICTKAGEGSTWMKLDPAARDAMELRMKKEGEEAKRKREMQPAR